VSDALLVCRCGEARSPADDDVGDWIVRLHSGEGHKVATDRHRADCSPPAGCRRCGEPMQGRFIFYCGPECRRLFEADHWWGQARSTALGWEWVDARRVARNGCVQVDETCVGALEVNHIEPLNGDRPDWGCCHHQEGLEVLCHSHHVRETAAQRRDGRIGTPETAARIRANDKLERAREVRRRLRQAMNPPLL